MIMNINIPTIIKKLESTSIRYKKVAIKIMNINANNVSKIIDIIINFTSDGSTK